jgi:hypothetical protein
LTLISRQFETLILADPLAYFLSAFDTKALVEEVASTLASTTVKETKKCPRLFYYISNTISHQKDGAKIKIKAKERTEVRPKLKPATEFPTPSAAAINSTCQSRVSSVSKPLVLESAFVNAT